MHLDKIIIRFLIHKILQFTLGLDPFWARHTCKLALLGPAETNAD
jgi:hypothetical protein